MQSSSHYQSTVEEKLIVGAILFTYPIYAIGGLYITGSALGYLVFGLVALRAFVEGKYIFRAVPAIVWVWVLGMILMLVSLLVAHGNWSLGAVQTIKSTVGWAKGWALLGLFPLLGAIVEIRPERIVRAICHVAKHTAIFAVITFVFYLARFPGELFVSPLQILGGAGDNFFMVSLYGSNPETGAGRWQFFAPWAPAAGFLSCIFVVFSLMEKEIKWRNWGVAGSVVMALLSQSRAGWAIFIFVVPMFLFSKQIGNPRILLLAGFLLPVLLVFGEPAYEWINDTFEQIKQARPASTRVRAALENLALQRWQAEAPIWGHGVVESGPKLVEFMPIGSHHSWYGLLFVKGIVGFVALAIPLLISLIYLACFIHVSQNARAAFCMLAIFICYSFFENLEILAYLYWPALFWLGLTFKNLQRRGAYV